MNNLFNFRKSSEKHWQPTGHSMVETKIKHCNSVGSMY